MMTTSNVTLKCNKCGCKWSTTKMEGGFIHRVSYDQGSCPDCGSHDVDESYGLKDAILSKFR